MGSSKEAQPLVHGPVAGDDEAGRLVPVEDEFVEVGGLLRSEPVQAQVVQNEAGRGTGRDRKVRPKELSTLAWDMALNKSSARLKRTVCPALTGGVAQGLGQEALADTGLVRFCWSQEVPFFRGDGWNRRGVRTAVLVPEAGRWCLWPLRCTIFHLGIPRVACGGRLGRSGNHLGAWDRRPPLRSGSKSPADSIMSQT